MFGHVHQSWAGHRNCVNVGVDHWDFRPVTLEEAAARGRPALFGGLLRL